MIDLTPEEEARLRRWLAMQDPDIEAAVTRMVEGVLAPENLAKLGDQLAAAVIPDIEAVLLGLNERVSALEKLVMRTLPVVRRQR